MTSLVTYLADPRATVRLRAVMAAGTTRSTDDLEVIVEQCATEPDLQVREMLTWALIRLPAEVVVPLVLRELDRPEPQARSQALHTLSKIGDARAWPWITRDLLRDDDDQVARTAWRVAAALVPEDAKEGLADELVTQLGRGSRDVHLSLSRALVDLGDGVAPALEKAAAHGDPAVAAHARATGLLLEDPEAGFDAAIEEAERVVRLGPERAAAAAAGAARC